MKNLIILLALLLTAVPTTLAQRVYTYRPLVNTTVDDSLVITAGSTLIRKVGTPLVVTVADTGVRVQGTGIPYGATITGVVAASLDSFYISQAAEATTAVANISFGVFTANQAYAAGDALGWLTRTPGFTSISNVVLTDDKDTIQTGATLAIFDTLIVPTADNAAFAPSDANVDHLSGVWTLSVINDWGSNRVITSPATTVPLDLFHVNPPQYFYVQLVAGGAANFAAMTNVTVTIVGE